MAAFIPPTITHSIIVKEKGAMIMIIQTSLPDKYTIHDNMSPPQLNSSYTQYQLLAAK